jgi:hypothetical protein
MKKPFLTLSNHMNDKENKTNKSNIAITGFGLGVLTVIAIVFIVQRC